MLNILIAVVSSRIRNSCVTKYGKTKKTTKIIHMFKEAISPLTFPAGDDCGEFKLIRLAGESTDPLTVDGPEAQFTSVGVERWGAETHTGCGRREMGCSSTLTSYILG